MSDPVNLNAVRKVKDKGARAVLAVENRFRHGRTKAERAAAKAAADQHAAIVDNAKLDRPVES